MLETEREVVRCLITYADWWQPTTASILQLGRPRADKNLRDGLNPGILETLDERTELCRRMSQMAERDRHILFLWYVRQLHVDDVAAIVKISRRQCFRRRAAAIRKLVELSEPQAA